jgi:hypothetical protein
MTLDIVISPAAADSNVIALTTRQRKERDKSSFLFHLFPNFNRQSNPFGDCIKNN